METEIKIEVIDVAGFPAVFRALRLPHGLEHRSSATAAFSLQSTTDGLQFSQENRGVLDKRDIELLSKLVKSGDEHAKVLRGLIVYMEVTAPRFWWVEMDTYRIGSERLSSESTMHIQGKSLSTEELVEMKSNLKEGTMQKRSQYFSYQTLRRIYFQRKSHRLPHWRNFCKVIESLPLAKELVICQK